MNVDRDRETVLLGAGASVDAGVPAGEEMTHKILDALGRVGASQDVVWAARIAETAMRAHDAAIGRGPADVLDVERLFSAVTLLSQRDDVEIAPFVGTWINALGPLGAANSLDADTVANIVSALGVDRGEPANLQSVDSALRTLAFEISTGSFAPLYGELRTWMFSALRGVCQVDGNLVDYLSPLLERGVKPRRVATLNYDRSLELAAEGQGLTVDVGIDRWAGGFAWEWDKSADLTLLKMHGSIDWVVNTRGTSRPSDFDPISIGTPPYQKGTNVAGPPAIVFGKREKLTHRGPFLAMLAEFDRFLAVSDRLLIIGYSFRDAHVNAAIGRWLSADATRRLSIIDPGIALEDPGWSDQSEPLRDLLSRITTPRDLGSRTSQVGRVHPRVVRAPHQIFHGTARDQLTAALAG